MKKFLAFVVLVLGLILSISLTTSPAFAYDAFSDACNGNTQASVCNDINSTNSQCKGDISCLNPLSGSDGILLRVTKLLAVVVGISSIIIIILAGLKYITADGDSNSITSAKHTIQYGLVGLAITLTAEGIILFVIKAIK